MHREAKRQYTIRSVPRALDRFFRQRARREGKSLNEILLDTLRRGAGLHQEPTVFTDLDACIGTWEEDGAFNAALAEQDTVDPGLWR